MSTDLAELFSRDPLKLSDQDIDSIIHELRQARSKFALDETAGLRPTGAPKTSKAVIEGEKAIKEAGLEIDLKSLLGG